MNVRISALSFSALALALAAGSVSAHALPVASTLHLHASTVSAVPVDKRITVKVFNPTNSFRDVAIDGHVYSVASHGTLEVTAPVGTPIYSATNRSRRHKKGSLVARISSDDKPIALD